MEFFHNSEYLTFLSYFIDSLHSNFDKRKISPTTKKKKMRSSFGNFNFVLFFFAEIIMPAIAYSTNGCESLLQACNKSSTSRYMLVCDNFNSFSQIDLSCEPREDELDILGFKKISQLSLAPKKPVVFDHSFEFSHSSILDSFVEILLYRITGVELTSSLFSDLNDKALVVLDSLFQVYHHGQKVGDHFNLNISQSVFSTTFSQVYFKPSVRFTSTIHPVLFKDAFIDTLKVYGLVDCFLRRNILKFSNQPVYINISIRSFQVHLDHFQLDGSLLNEFVFSNLESLTIIGQVSAIDAQIFKKLVKLNWINFRLYSLHKFMHSIGLSWLCKLANSSGTRYVSFEQLETDNPPPHSKNVFGDEDFCLYSDLNVPQNIYLDVQESLIDNCSCSFIWIIKSSLKDHSFLPCVNSINFTEFAAKCAFEQKLANCKPSHGHLTNLGLEKFEETYSSLFKMIKFYLVTSAKPVLCLICLTLSVLDIKIILIDPNMLGNKSKMYRYIFLAAIIDSVIVMLYLSELLNECIEPSGIYCVEFRKNLQLFKIIFQVYVRSVLEMLSNSMSIAFSLNRYVINTPTCSELLKKTETVSVRRVFGFLLVICLVLNLNTIFDFVPTVESFEGDENSDKFYPRLNVELFSKSVLFMCVFYFNLFVNDIVCAFAILVIDLFLIQSVKENLRKKYQLTSVVRKSSSSKNKKKATEEMVKKSMLFSFLQIDKIQQLNLIKKYRENKTIMMKKSGKEFKITLMVVLNGAFTLIFRLPQLVISFMLVSLNRRERIMMSRTWEETPESIFNESVEFQYNFFNEFSKLFYIVSLIFKSLIYYIFDKNFKRGVRMIFKPKMKKTKK